MLSLCKHEPNAPIISDSKVPTQSSQFPLDPLQAAESKPPPKPVKKESKKEKKEMSLLDLDDCEHFSSLRAVSSKFNLKTTN